VTIEEIIFDKKTNQVVYIWNNYEKWEFLIVSNEEVRKIEWKSTIIYQNEEIKSPYYSDDLIVLNSKWVITFKTKNTISYIWRTKELYDIAKNYEKYYYWYLSEDKKTTILLWKKWSTYYIIRNWEEIVTTDKFVSWVYPIDWWKSFIYDYSWDKYTNRVLVECNN
jgi:hypothetical protein